MSDVKTATRILRLFEVFAEEKGPLSLTEIAEKLQIPSSSCFQLVRTMLSHGYLYELSRRGGYYPSRRMWLHAQQIVDHDPLIERLSATLSDVREATRETAILSKLQGHQVIFLLVFESPHSVRFTASAGSLASLHATSAGKALLSTLEPSKRRELLQQAGLDRRTANTITSMSALDRELRSSTERGWFSNAGESIEDVGAIALPVRLFGEAYAVAVVGPLYRMEPNIDDWLAALRSARERLEQMP